ncbi:MAG: hypothetical protein LBS36_03545 [Oscillospiraceae bacterium]|jgi:type IV pilus assembly protein PilO|nr:hypothetical protein [Oscillospiraceae bacterium]
MRKRERYLIILLGFMIIVLGGYKSLIEPQYNKLLAAKKELQSAEDERQKSIENVRDAQAVEVSNAQLENDIRELYQAFFPELENDKVQIFFEDIAGSVGVSYTSFAMSEKSVSTIEPFYPVENSVSYPAKDAASSINVMNGAEEPGAPAVTEPSSQSQGDSAAASEPSSQKNDSSQNTTTNPAGGGEVEKMDVTIQFDAGYDTISVFLDAIKNSGRMVRITAINIAQPSQSQEGEQGAANVLRANISVECFGLKKISDDDPLSKDSLQFGNGRANPFGG